MAFAPGPPRALTSAYQRYVYCQIRYVRHARFMKTIAAQAFSYLPVSPHCGVYSQPDAGTLGTHRSARITFPTVEFEHHAGLALDRGTRNLFTMALEPLSPFSVEDTLMVRFSSSW